MLVAGLVLIGIGLLIISLIVNARVVHSVRKDERHQEKHFEYYRNTFSQLGVVLIGIGISLFIFFFQQSYKDEHDRDAELRQILAKMAIRIGRGAPIMESLAEFDPILDDGGPYIDPQTGGENGAVTARGADLAKQVQALFLVERDIDLHQFEILNFSNDLESSFVINELDPHLWFNIARDESYAKYAMTQLEFDYQDLHRAIGQEPVELAVTNSKTDANIKREVLDVLYDADLLRDRSRRLIARASWFLSKGAGFTALHSIDETEADYNSHHEWLDHAQRIYGGLSAGNHNCIKLLWVPPSSEIKR